MLCKKKKRKEKEKKKKKKRKKKKRKRKRRRRRRINLHKLHHHLFVQNFFICYAQCLHVSANILHDIKEKSITFRHFVTPREIEAANIFGFLVSDIIKLSARSVLRPFDSGGTSMGTKEVTGRWAGCWKFL